MVSLLDIAGAEVTLQGTTYEAAEVAIWNGENYDVIWPIPIGGGDSQFFEALYEEGTNDIIGVKALYDLYAPKVVSFGDVIAYADSGSGDGGESPIAYTRLDPTTFGQTPADFVWPQYDSAKNGWVLSAALGWNLLSKFSSLTLGDLINVSTAGAQYGQALIFNGSSWVPGDVSSQGTVVDRYFEDILNGSSVLVGAHAMYDLHITQDPGSTYSSGNDKNISEILRHWSLSSGNLLSDTNVLVQGDVVAYGNSISGTAPTAYTRLDAWVGYDGTTMAGYVLSAALGWDLNTRVIELEEIVGSSWSGGGGGTGESTALQMPATYFTVSNNPANPERTLQVAFGTASDGSSYTLPSVIDMSLFDPEFDSGSGSGNNNTVVGILGNYPLTVNGNVVAIGDVVAYGTSSGSVSPVNYTRLDPEPSAAESPEDYVWPIYASAQDQYVLSGALGWNLQERLSTLEQSAGAGSVTSVALTMPASFSVSGSPITSTGTLAVTMAEGYTIPTIQQINKIQEYDDLFDAIYGSGSGSGDGGIEGILAKYYLRVDGDVLANGDVVAYGSSSGSVSPTAYTRLDTWTGYNDQTMAGYVLSAHLGKDIEDRVSLLELYIGSGSGSGGSISLELNDLSDVDTTGATNGYVLSYDNGSWKPQQASGGISLADVWSSLTTNTSPYDSTYKIISDHLPLASDSAFGIVKQGTNISISSGVISATIPTASTGVKGGIVIGNGLKMTGTYSDTLTIKLRYSGNSNVSLLDVSSNGLYCTIDGDIISSWGFTKNAGTLTGVKFNGTSASVSNGVAEISATIPSEVTESTVSGWGFTKNAGTLTGVKFNGTDATVAGGIATITATIPSEVTESTVSGWGFTKNMGTVTGVKINGTDATVNGAGIASLTLSIPDENTVSGWGFTKNAGTITGITMNGSSKGTSGVVDLGTVITSHQDISGKLDKLSSSTTNNFVAFSNTTGGIKDSGKSASDFLAIAGGTLTGSLNIQATSSASDKEIRIYYRNSANVYATLKVDSNGNLLITPKSGAAIKVVGGDVVAYSSS